MVGACTIFKGTGSHLGIVAIFGGVAAAAAARAASRAARARSNDDDGGCLARPPRPGCRPEARCDVCRHEDAAMP